MRALLIAFSATVLLAAPAAAEIGGGELTLEVPGAGSVAFCHDDHVAGAALACTECHDRLYVTRAQHQKVSMKEMRQGRSCGACHDGKRAFSVQENCERCHAKEVK